MSSDTKVVGYCRTCGKPLDATSMRQAQGTIYCEEHAPVVTMENPQTVPPLPPLPQLPRIEGASPVGSTAGSNPYTANPYTSSYSAPPALSRTDISPGLAFILGLIPGVGAIYNGQYAKGLTHVVIFGLMITILSSGAADTFLPLVSLLLAGFCCYMPFEAFHTAKRRQEGLVVDEFSSLFPVHGSKFPVAAIVFIALGVILLLSNLDLLDFSRVLRYWPVLLIALGAYMLIGRMGGSRMDGAKAASHGSSERENH